MEEVMLITGFITVAGWYLLLLYSGRKLNGITEESFAGGASKAGNKPSAAFLKLQIKRYSNQQNLAFGLLWFSVCGSLVLGSVLLYKKVIIGDANSEWIKECIGLAGGSGISLASFRLYKITSKKVEDLISKL